MKTSDANALPLPVEVSIRPLRKSVPRWAGTALRVVIGLVLGAGTAVVASVFLVVAALITVPVLPFTTTRRALTARVHRISRHLAELDRRRIAFFLGGDNSPEYTGRRALGYLILHAPIGLLGGMVLLILCAGLVIASVGVQSAVLGNVINWGVFAYNIAFGVVLFFLNVTGIAGVALLDQALARKFLGPSARALFERRIDELATSRAGVVEAINDERRRIERDLHDGVQQRMVALGMLLGRARRSGDQARIAELLESAHLESQQILDDLRNVAWRVFPSALDDGGLHAAVEAVAERSVVPIDLRYELRDRFSSTVETAAYFVVCEAATNAAKHSEATVVKIHIGQQGGTIVVTVTDNGVGGADPSGGGLSGLGRRVAALDGKFTVDSPLGGPTTITAELPCG